LKREFEKEKLIVKTATKEEAERDETLGAFHQFFRPHECSSNSGNGVRRFNVEGISAGMKFFDKEAEIVKLPSGPTKQRVANLIAIFNRIRFLTPDDVKIRVEENKKSNVRVRKRRKTSKPKASLGSLGRVERPTDAELESFKMKVVWDKIFNSLREDDIESCVSENRISWNQQTSARLLHCLKALHPMKLICFDADCALFIFPVAQSFYESKSTSDFITGIFSRETNLLSTLACAWLPPLLELTGVSGLPIFSYSDEMQETALCPQPIIRNVKPKSPDELSLHLKEAGVCVYWWSKHPWRASLVLLTLMKSWKSEDSNAAKYLVTTDSIFKSQLGSEDWMRLNNKTVMMIPHDAFQYLSEPRNSSSFKKGVEAKTLVLVDVTRVLSVPGLGFNLGSNLLAFAVEKKQALFGSNFKLGNWEVRPDAVLAAGARTIVMSIAIFRGNEGRLKAARDEFNVKHSKVNWNEKTVDFIVPNVMDLNGDDIKVLKIGLDGLVGNINQEDLHSLLPHSDTQDPKSYGKEDLSNTKLDLAVDRILAWIFEELGECFDLSVSTGMKFLNELTSAFVESRIYQGQNAHHEKQRTNQRKGGDLEGFIVPDDESDSEHDEDESGDEIENKKEKKNKKENLFSADAKREKEKRRAKKLQEEAKQILFPIKRPTSKPRVPGLCVPGLDGLMFDDDGFPTSSKNDNDLKFTDGRLPTSSKDDDKSPVVSKSTKRRSIVHDDEAQIVAGEATSSAIARNDALSCPFSLDHQIPLSDEDKLSVSGVLTGSPTEDVVAQVGAISITKRLIKCLAPLTKDNDENFEYRRLNDEIISAMMLKLMQRDQDLCIADHSRLPSHYFNHFFVEKLLINVENIRRWTRKFNIFAMDKIFCPRNFVGHWAIAVIFVQLKIIRYYDSLDYNGDDCLQALRSFIRQEAERWECKDFNEQEWELIHEKAIPQQTNGIDCGIFAIMYAACLTEGLPFLFDQKSIPLLRNKVCATILKDNDRSSSQGKFSEFMNGLKDRLVQLERMSIDTKGFNFQCKILEALLNCTEESKEKYNVLILSDDILSRFKKWGYYSVMYETARVNLLSGGNITLYLPHRNDDGEFDCLICVSVANAKVRTEIISRKGSVEPEGFRSYISALTSDCNFDESERGKQKDDNCIEVHTQLHALSDSIINFENLPELDDQSMIGYISDLEGRPEHRRFFSHDRTIEFFASSKYFNLTQIELRMNCADWILASLPYTAEFQAKRRTSEFTNLTLTIYRFDVLR